MAQFKSNIYIVGVMGTGKSTVGRELAKLLGRQLIDIDREIEKETNMTISEIFELRGEEYFKEKELQMVKKLADMRLKIISAGGRAILNDEIRKIFLDTGLIICIYAEEEILLERLKKLDKRPELGGEEGLPVRLREFLEKKGQIYKDVAIQLDTSSLTPMQAAQKIINLLKVRRNILDELKNQYLEL